MLVVMVVSRDVVVMMLMMYMDRDIQQNMFIKCLETCKKNIVFSGGGRRGQTYIIRTMFREVMKAQATDESNLKLFRILAVKIN